MIVSHTCPGAKNQFEAGFPKGFRFRTNVGGGQLAAVGLHGFSESELADRPQGVAGGALALGGVDVLLHPVLGDREKLCAQAGEFSVASPIGPDIVSARSDACRGTEPAWDSTRSLFLRFSFACQIAILRLKAQLFARRPYKLTV
ncbi:MAG: hypothetical protein WDN28_29465 [Chthoniobacter sp.]